jgi:hypothetical protein
MIKIGISYSTNIIAVLYWHEIKSNENIANNISKLNMSTEPNQEALKYPTPFLYIFL